MEQISVKLLIYVQLHNLLQQQQQDARTDLLRDTYITSTEIEHLFYKSGSCFSSFYKVRATLTNAFSYFHSIRRSPKALLTLPSPDRKIGESVVQGLFFVK